MYKAIIEQCKEKGLYSGDADINLGIVIRAFREQKGKKAVEVAKSSGIDPRTFTAIETGRIKNPSLQNIQAIAKALDVSPAEIFSKAELDQKKNAYQGDQKGEFSLEFPSENFRIISFTPIVPEFFVGKIHMGASAKINADALPIKGRIFIQVILGKLKISVTQNEFCLKEGDHFLLSSSLPHCFENPLMKESSFLLVTVPSFLTLASC